MHQIPSRTRLVQPMRFDYRTSGPTPDAILDLASLESEEVDGLVVDAWLCGGGNVCLGQLPTSLAGRVRRRLASSANGEHPNAEAFLSHVEAQPGQHRRYWLRVRSDALKPLAEVTTRLFPAQSLTASMDDRYWFTNPSTEALRDVRKKTNAKLIYEPKSDLGLKVERLAAELASYELDGICLSHGFWTKGTVALFNKFGLTTFASGTRFERQRKTMARAGLDGLVP